MLSTSESPIFNSTTTTLLAEVFAQKYEMELPEKQQETPLTADQADSYAKLAEQFYENKQYYNAIKEYEYLLQYYNSSKQLIKAGDTCRKIAECNSNLFKRDNAIYYLNKSLTHYAAHRSANSILGIKTIDERKIVISQINSYMELADNYYDKGKAERAQGFAESARALNNTLLLVTPDTEDLKNADAERTQKISALLEKNEQTVPNNTSLASISRALSNQENKPNDNLNCIKTLVSTREKALLIKPRRPSGIGFHAAGEAFPTQPTLSENDSFSLSKPSNEGQSQTPTRRP